MPAEGGPARQLTRDESESVWPDGARPGTRSSSRKTDGVSASFPCPTDGRAG